MTELTDFINASVAYLRTVVPHVEATWALIGVFVLAAAIRRRIVGLVIVGWIIALVALVLWLAPPISGAWMFAGLIALISALAFTVTPAAR